MVEVARIELRETDCRRTQAIEQFRELIRKHPRIKNCQTDSISLLRFLRVKKYAVLAALKMLEDYLMERKKFPLWNINLTLEDSQINGLFDSGCVFPLLEKDKLGRQGVFYGCTPFDSTKFLSTAAIRLNALLYTHLSQVEDTQVGGVVVIYDASSLTIQALSAFTITQVHNWFNGIQKAIPMRIKKVYMFNMPAVANVMFKIALGPLGQKVKSRILIHANVDEFLENFEEHDILPKEYGGKVPWREMVEKYKEQLRKTQKRILAMDDEYIDEDVGVNKKNCGDGLGLTGSFRKLEVD